jgi:hypothetical protein
MARPPEPFPGFEDCVAMPEVARRTIGDVGLKGLGLGLLCRACGRHALFSPLGIRTQLHRYRVLSVETFAKACRCQTCGAADVVAHGLPLEPKQHSRPYIVIRERYGGARLDLG